MSIVHLCSTPLGRASKSPGFDRSDTVLLLLNSMPLTPVVSGKKFTLAVASTAITVKHACPEARYSRICRSKSHLHRPAASILRSA